MILGLRILLRDRTNLNRAAVTEPDLGTPLAMIKENDAIKAVALSPAAIAEQPLETFADLAQGHGLTWKTLLSSSKTPTDTFTSGIAILVPGIGQLCPHSHKQAELYHIIDGSGVVEIDGAEHEVEKGSVVFISGNARHGVRNTSAETALVWLYVFATDDFGDIRYKFEHEERNRKEAKASSFKARL